MEKILTISIAAYNAEKDIARCLESFVHSGVIEKLEIIVVNDGSKDSTVEITNSYVEKYGDSIRLVDKKNGGHGSTINTSIRLATGKYFKIVDSDDWVESENISKLICFLEDKEVDLVLNPYHEVSYFDHNKRKLIQYDKKDLVYGEVYNISKLSKDTVLHMHSLTFKTNVIRQMGAIIDEHCFYVDMEYCVFPMLYVHSFTHLEYPIYQYLLGSQTQSMNMKNLVNRRDQHLRVVKRLLDFYNENESKFEDNLKCIVQLRIKYAVYQQYKIFFSMTESGAKKEVKEFDKWLKQQNSFFYGSNVPGRFMKIVQVNRSTSFIMFTLSVKLFKDKL